MSFNAYQQAATRAENPRDMEYRLFAQVTRALMDAAACDPDDLRGRIDALDWNRRMWAVLGSDCQSSENKLPQQLRASIISLSIWVSKHTTLVIRKQEDIEPLIEVNRMIMQGLASNGSAAAAA
ncbi:flagellar biosynthesis regulator FlaF [Phenylobacterium sp. J426]|uniref:flagellar biosynthesis regulator FlaF n=1 Tax=Phenylobacterium sp. J426 TaxID=2898439 RepID=UPI002151E475|nr:flagellar biosynthesis regulator FlaF [Phenylobacterium sp. J426]MCR5875948.1 flagellar biosynthesis regulator FlaF [Phenylobacterium sp. J426]